MDKATFDGLIAAKDMETLEKVCKPYPIANVGDVILVRQMYSYVNKVIHWHPDDQNRPKGICPIQKHYVAVQLKTDIGDRWWGYDLNRH